MQKGVVWYVSQYAAPLKYTFGSRHFFLANEFQKLGYKTYVIASAYNKFFEGANKFPPSTQIYNCEVIDGVETVWIKGITYKKNGGVKRILSWFLFTYRLLFIPQITIEKPTVVIISSLSLPPILAGIYFKYKYKCKLIVEIRDIWPLTLVDVVGVSKYHPLVLLLGWIEKQGYNYADVITATMPAADQHIKQIINKPFKFTCIPQGVLPQFLDKKAPLPPNFRELNIPTNKFIIGYAGSLSSANTIDVLIAAMAQLDATKFHACIMGNGPDKEFFKTLAKQLTNITFIDGVDKQQVASFLAYCDILYLGVKKKKIYEYGLSLNKCMDYMYAAKPIVMSYTGTKNIILDANCGNIVPAEDPAALANLITTYSQKSVDELKEIGLRGKTYLVNNCTFEKLGAQYTQLF